MNAEAKTRRHSNANRSHAMRLCPVLALSVLMATALTAEWQPGEWRGRPAWVAQQDGWSAVVCPTWGRLVSLRTPDDRDFLYVPTAATVQERIGSTAGGHLAWLGPQSRWGWPPPAHWEYNPALNATIVGAELHLRSATSTDRRFPDVARSYAWEPNGLRCTMRWRNDQSWYGIQVFQVADAARVSLRPLVGPDLPHGVAIAIGSGQPPARSDLSLPFPGIALEGGRAVIGHGDTYVKALWPLQPIEATLGDWRLTLSRLDPLGGEEPEGGKVTMTFSGPEPGMVEIEQASPMVPPGQRGNSVVLLTMGRTGG